MNRTDRLYALVEELRAASPRCRSAADLAARFEVSARTIERDISALQRSGVPVHARPGRRGGYTLGRPATPAPLNFTPAEAVAVAVALGRAGPQPYARHARSALRKVVTAMPARDGEPARDPSRDPAARLPEGRPRAEADDRAASAAVARVIEDALLRRRVLHLGYEDTKGVLTTRDVEPGVFLGGLGGYWYLVGWCRLRDDVRVFRLDRITAAAVTAEPCSGRAADELTGAVPDVFLRRPVLDP